MAVLASWRQHCQENCLHVFCNVFWRIEQTVPGKPHRLVHTLPPPEFCSSYLQWSGVVGLCMGCGISDEVCDTCVEPPRSRFAAEGH